MFWGSHLSLFFLGLLLAATGVGAAVSPAAAWAVLHGRWYDRKGDRRLGRAVAVVIRVAGAALVVAGIALWRTYLLMSIVPYPFG